MLFLIPSQQRQSTEVNTLQGSPTSLKVLKFSTLKFKALKVLKNDDGAEKSVKVLKFNCCLMEKLTIYFLRHCRIKS